MIKNIKTDNELSNAVKIFTGAFVNDTLFTFSFPDKTQRERLTNIIYGFVVFELVPLMNLELRGLYENNDLVAVCTYTTPESNTMWTNKLDEAVKRMWSSAKDDSIKLIGEYSMQSRNYKIEEPHFYFNELAVAPEEQGKGHGKKMFEYVESECREHQTAKGIYLDTPNPVNVKIYEHIGYKVVHKFEFRELTGHIMYKSIK